MVSEAFIEFKEKKLDNASRLWHQALKKNVLQWNLQDELNRARQDILQIDVHQDERKQFLKQLDRLDLWYGIKKGPVLEIRGLSKPIISIFSILFYDDHLFLSDEFNHRILKIGLDGKLVCEIGRKGQKPGEFWYPQGIAISPSGENQKETLLACCDSWNHRIQFFSTDGKFLYSFGSFGLGPNEFRLPYDLAFCNDGNICIVDKCNHRIKKVTLDGELIDIIGNKIEESLFRERVTTELENSFSENGDPLILSIQEESVLQMIIG